MRCEKILKLRRGERAGLAVPPPTGNTSNSSDTNAESADASYSRRSEGAAVKFEQSDADVDQIEECSPEQKTREEKKEVEVVEAVIDGSGGEPDKKKCKAMSLEEYEAALDEDDTFADVDLDLRAPCTDDT